MASTFTLFPQLAPEIRNHIWRDALPEVGPSLFYYKKGYWQPRRLTESDEGFVAGNDNMELRFRHDLLPNDEFDLPLFHVCRESRSIVLPWLRRQGIHIQCRQDGQFVLVRPFDLELDILYVPDHLWEDFCIGASYRLAEPDMRDMDATLQSWLQRIAVSEELFCQCDIVWLAEALSWHDHVVDVSVVVGNQPDQGQGRWELRNMQGIEHAWNEDIEDYQAEETDEESSHMLGLETVEESEKIVGGVMRREMSLRRVQAAIGGVVRRVIIEMDVFAPAILSVCAVKA
ncbi:hypothetical protein M434DRAFT_38790 [Hypoxylon sp. CO27-5]|nr:hypothetical protein M434DRAFT_38790 [Hypoxylon sp. CO27-5]